MRSSIEVHDGFLFSHTGEGVVAAFAWPRSAVDAAVAARRRVELRMGIGTGEAELRDGDGTVIPEGAGCVKRLLSSGFAGFRAPCRQHWVRAGVKTERPQRSEDERS